jgi:hypothetical protein
MWIFVLFNDTVSCLGYIQGSDNSLAQPGRKQATATEDFDVHISYLLHTISSPHCSFPQYFSDICLVSTSS